MEIIKQDNETIKKETILVDLDKIEKLVNKVADLVITNSMMAQNIENLQNEDDKKKMIETTSLFERHIKEMQDYAMELRMINMSDIYEYLPVLVNNAALKNNKKIELQTFGSATKIDKSMLELLRKILNLILENAAEHGIETPEERLLKGKKENGLLTVNTEQINGQIVITFADDGRGIDLKKIEKNAMLRGVVTKEELENMSDNDKASLILHEESMLKIKESINKLSGSISIETKKDIGTTISIYIPLSLSILDGLNIRIGKHFFILPIPSIIESLRPSAENIKAVGDGTAQLLMLRNDFIPIVKMNEYLNIKSDHEKLVEGMLIVVKAGKEKVALFIDEFLHQQQVVVKPVDRNFRNVIGISGATVCGDSSIRLIIDVQGIIDDKRHMFDYV